MEHSNKYDYILNTQTGVLHTKECANGEMGYPPIKEGRIKKFQNIEDALLHPRYRKKHNVSKCMGVN